MRRVIINATPIIGLSIIGKLDLRFVVMDERAARDLAQMFLLKPIYQQVLKHANEN